jgi:CubicO group peptidase (beta-lactamase class C family)
VASCTKPFVAAAAWSLVAEGALDLDAPVRTLVPGFTLGDARASDSLTMRDLLAHRRGLRNEAIGTLTAYSGEITEQRWRYWLPRVRASNRFGYNNLNYQLAARVLEQRTGRTWQQLVQERVFSPIGMTDAVLTGDGLAGRADVARAYVTRGGQAVEVPNKSNQTMHAAGGSGASARDLARWLRAHLADGRLDAHQAIPASVIRGMRDMQIAVSDRHPLRADQKRIGWSAGWEMRLLGNDTMYVHTGSYQGAAAHMSFVPARGVGVAVLVNSNLPPLSEVVAAEAYDWAAGGESPDVRERLEQFAARMQQPADSDTLPRRAPMPTRGLAGRYSDAAWGTLRIEAHADSVAMRLGGYPMSVVWSGTDRFLADDGSSPGAIERAARGDVRAVWLKLTAQDSVRFVKR